MTSSRLKASRSNRSAALAVLALAVALVAWFSPRVAEAQRKRVVILDLEGANAEKFTEGLVKLVKKTHTVVPVSKWDSKAEELDATKLTDANVKKVAKKLKIDAVVSGTVAKRRDEYILQLKIRDGKTGAVLGNRIDVTSGRGSIDASASRDLKDELVASISSIGGGGGGEDGEEVAEAPKKKKKKAVEEEEEEEEVEEEPEEPKKTKKQLAAEAAAKKKEEEAAAKAEKEEKERAKKEALAKKKAAEEEEEEEEEEAPRRKKKKGFGKGSLDEEAALKTKSDDAEEEEEESPLPKKKRTASADEDEEEEGISASAGDVDDTPSDNLAVGERALEAVLGMSLTARRLSFTMDPGLMNKPPPYNGVPVAGANLEITAYPLAFGHKNRGKLRGLGLTVFYDRVLKISSKAQGVELPTSQQRFMAGAVFRYPLGRILTAGAMLRAGKQSFTISSAGGVPAPLPDVSYTIVEPTAFLRLTPVPKVTVNLSAGFLGILNTGEMQSDMQYGAATVTGVEFEGGVDVMVTKNIFVRGAFRYQQIGYSFKGFGAELERDNDPSSVDVFGAADKYVGGTILAGYLY